MSGIQAGLIWVTLEKCQLGSRQTEGHVCACSDSHLQEVTKAKTKRRQDCKQQRVSAHSRDSWASHSFIHSHQCC